jgi:hypothetical protein
MNARSISSSDPLFHGIKSLRTVLPTTEEPLSPIRRFLLREKAKVCLSWRKLGFQGQTMLNNAKNEVG